MVKLNKDDLENALSSAANDMKAGKKESENQLGEMSGEEEIGFHKGSINTLAAERNELIKMVGNVEAIMQAHMGRLKELGVEIEGKK